jgi:hypothetical protein
MTTRLAADDRPPTYFDGFDRFRVALPPPDFALAVDLAELLVLADFVAADFVPVDFFAVDVRADGFAALAVVDFAVVAFAFVALELVLRFGLSLPIGSALPTAPMAPPTTSPTVPAALPATLPTVLVTPLTALPASGIAFPFQPAPVRGDQPLVSASGVPMVPLGRTLGAW